MKKTLLSTALSAGLIALASTAFAQTSPSSPSGGGAGSSGGAMQNEHATPPSGAPGGGAAGSETGGAAGGSAAEKPSTPPKSAVGKDVVNATGDTIGEVDSIAGDQLIVSTGGFLGMGARKVALPWDQITVKGSGKDEKLQTAMTKEQLKALPEYKGTGGAGGGGATSPGESGGTSGGASGGASGSGGGLGGGASGGMRGGAGGGTH